MSESAKYISLTRRYLNGHGVDVGSGGWPVVPWAIQVELPRQRFEHYNQRPLPENIQWTCDLFHDGLPFKDGALDFVYSSHLIEDFSQEQHWPLLFREWARCLKKGGLLVVLVPEVVRWNEAIKKGQPPNCSHWAPEPSVGDLSKAAAAAGLTVLKDELTNLTPEDYSILGVFEKP